MKKVKNKMDANLKAKLAEHGLSDHEITRVNIAIAEMESVKYRRWTKIADFVIIIGLTGLVLSYLSTWISSI